MVFEIVGREAELASLNAFIDETEGGAAALVLEGEAGVGKSTLWGAAVEHARARGVPVLSSPPSEMNAPSVRGRARARRPVPRRTAEDTLGLQPREIQL